MSAKLLHGLKSLGCPEYYGKFVEHGIEDWDTFMLLTDRDLQNLGVGLTHRETIQQVKTIVGFSDPEKKRRRYRRHPKPDANAPARPPTAYVVFSNEYRQNLTQQQSFVDIAKEVGSAWQALSADDKAKREKSADDERKRYRDALSDYKRTESYQQYMDYLRNFHKDESSKTKDSRSGFSFNTDPQDRENSRVKTKSESTTSASPATDEHVKRKESFQRGKPDQTTFNDLLYSGKPNQTSWSRSAERTVKLQEDESPQTSMKVEQQHLNWDVEGILYDLVTEELSSKVQSSDHQISTNVLNRVSRYTVDNQQLQDINPFKFQPQARSSTYLESFLQLNDVFFFFDKQSLRQNFELAYTSSTPLPGRIMAELCLALAIGGQWTDTGNDDNCLMWYENGRRYVDNEGWDHDTWVMRTMGLICMYHIGARADTAQHYLHVGLRIAHANGFFHGMEDIQSIDDKDMSTWLRVWTTLKILYCYTEIEPVSAFHELSEFGLDEELTSTPDFTSSERKEYAAFIMMHQLSTISHSIGQEIYEDRFVPLHTFELHYNRLETFAASLSGNLNLDISLQYPFDPFTENARSCVLGELLLVTMYFGITIVLLRPLLLKVIQHARSGKEMVTDQDNRMNFLAFSCIQIAQNLTRFSVAMLNNAALPAKSWLSSRFNYEAALVGLLGVIWLKRSSRLQYASHAHLNQLRIEHCMQIVGDAMAVLQHCATREPVVGVSTRNINHLREILQSL